MGSAIDSLCGLVLQGRVGISQPGEVSGSREGIQFAKHGVVERAFLELADAAVWVAQIPKNDRVRRAGLGACGGDLTIADSAVPFVGFDARGGNALHAVSALFHHAAAAHGDLWVVHQL